MVTSCSPRVITSFQKVYTPSLPTSEEVVVIETTDPSKAQGEFLGQIKITDTGFTATSNGTYSQVVNLAKYETWKAGGNLMIINQHQLPDAWSTIHRINALAFKVFLPAGEIKLMPGTSASPAYRRIDVDVETGHVHGLF